MNTTPTTTEIAAYTPTKAALAGLRTKYEKVVYDVTTTQGMIDAKAAKKELAAHRITLENARKAEKEESLAYGRRVDSQAKEIAVQIAALEDPITDMIETETKRVERERQAAIEAEQRRLAEEERARKEAEERKLTEEREKLAAERRMLEEAAAKQKAMLEEAARASRLQLEEAEKASRERIAQAEAKARAERQAEEDRLRAERLKLDEEQRSRDAEKRRIEQEAEAKATAERRAKEDAERKVREEAEAVERERQRFANEIFGAREMLDTFKTRFGHLKPFAKVVKAIDALPSELKVAA